MVNIWEALREQALEQSKDMADNLFTVRALWKSEVILQHELFHQVSRYFSYLAITTGQGCCHFPDDLPLKMDIVGKDARQYLSHKDGVSIALLDSIYSNFPSQPYQTHELHGSPAVKTRLRSALIVDEAARLVAHKKNRDVRVVNVGAVDDIVRILGERGCQTFATDMDETLIGQNLHGTAIESGQKTTEYVKNCDLAIVTGMTLATNSLDEIVTTAREAGTKLLVFAETGANFADTYCRTIGIDTVISEPFPFYVHQGVTTINVYRK